MKKWIAGLYLTFAVCLAVTFVVNRYLENKLRKPTPAQVKAAFPKNTRDIFEHSDKFILLSLAGMEASLPGSFELASFLPASDTRELTRPMFHHYRILGQTEIKDKDIQERIRAIYDDGISDTHFSHACFSPKHGIRAVKNGRTLDIVICFHCSQAAMYLDDKGVAWSHFGSVHQPEFDAILTAAHVPLPNKR
jgi:hypothetical protein